MIIISSFTFIDSLIIAAYLIIVLSLGLYYSRKKENTIDYFLGGRNIGWITIGLSIFATNISSEHFIGLAGSGSARGLAVAQFELMAIFILIILGWFIAPIYIRAGVTTTPEFLEKRFDPSSRKFFSALSIIIYLVTKISVTLFAGGILFNKIFGLSMYTSAIIVVFITGVYSVIGGTSAVMRTHTFQAIVLTLGALILTLFGLTEVGGFSGLYEKLPADYFNMFKSASDPDYPWTGILFGAPIIAFWYWCADQFIVQRVLCAKSINDARRGSLLAAALKITPIFILVIPGLIAAVLYPGITGDEAYPLLIAGNILPAGIKGFVIAGLLAAIMSSLSGVFNSASSLFTNDFYKTRHPEASDRELVLVGRLSTTFIVIAAILCVPLVKIISSQMYLYLQSVQAYVSPPVTAVFVLGLLWKKVNGKSAIWTLIIGESLGLTRLVTEIILNLGFKHPILEAYAGINFLHFAIILFVISSLVLLTATYLTHSKEELRYPKKNYLFADSFSEIKLSLMNPSGAGGYKVNLMFSLFIILVILGLWTLWY